jgi:hypothetical protein
MNKILVPVIIALLCSSATFAKSFVIHNGDTINRIDKNDLRQGMWNPGRRECPASADY